MARQDDLSKNIELSLKWKINKYTAFLFYLYIYPPDSQESDRGANT